MKRILKHALEMPFVTAVSIAALLHSSWSLSTYFTGSEPTPQFTTLWFAWVLPGALIGIAIDIGILSIAIELKHGQRSRAKLAAFFVLSAAMFYLQFLYLAAHTPLVPIAPGVSAGWLTVATTLRDLSVWVIPALLPLACLLYAFSDRKNDKQEPARQNRDQRRAALIAGMESAPIASTPSALPKPNEVGAPMPVLEAVNETQESPAAKPKKERKRAAASERTVTADLVSGTESEARPTLPVAGENKQSELWGDAQPVRNEPSPVNGQNRVQSSNGRRNEGI
jgi:hypothetical protein